VSSNYSIYLLRHGQVTGPPALYGSTDIPMSELGWQQLVVQTKNLKFDHVIASPLTRCCDFAEQLANARNLMIELDSDLRECDFGIWDGIPFDSINSDNWNELEQFWHKPAESTLTNAEPLADMHSRVIQSWHQHLSTLNTNTLVIAHGGVIRIILAQLLGQNWREPKWYSTLKIGYGSLTKITVHNETTVTPTVDYIGFPPPLPEGASSNAI